MYGCATSVAKHTRLTQLHRTFLCVERPRQCRHSVPCSRSYIVTCYCRVRILHKTLAMFPHESFRAFHHTAITLWLIASVSSSGDPGGSHGQRDRRVLCGSSARSAVLSCQNS